MEIPTPLARYNQVLEIVSAVSDGVNLNQLVEQSGLPKSTAHRLAGSLCVAGYLRVQEGGRYVLGPTLMELLKRSFAANAKSFLPHAILSSITAELGETTFFARRIDKHIELLEAITPEFSGQSYVYPGLGQRPIDVCSSSKAILAYVAHDVAKEIYEFYERDKGLSTSDWTSFNRMLEKVRESGIAVCDGEIDEGVFSIACHVPVAEMSGLFCIGVVGPTARMKQKTIKHLHHVIQTGAEKASNYIAERMFHNDGPNNNDK